ncbi:MAG: hypothetical protein Q9201_001874 [Fulgogasparrea decipioides]
MPADDYASAAGGGLRLKGVNPSSKISKHKKKRPKPQSDPEKGSPSPNPDGDASKVSQKPKEDDGSREKLDGDNAAADDDEASITRGKTQAELQHEERRRRRLEERLKREGTKTHKERVEEFNHYLSSLSEHHDMPRIGPG